MKKVRIMLLSLAVLAVVGGALAFKAKTTWRYCTSLAVDNGLGVFTCPAGVTCPATLSVTNIGVGTTFMCTTPTNGVIIGDECTITTASDPDFGKSIKCPQSPVNRYKQD